MYSYELFKSNYKRGRKEETNAGRIKREKRSDPWLPNQKKRAKPQLSQTIIRKKGVKGQSMGKLNKMNKIRL